MDEIINSEEFQAMDKYYSSLPINNQYSKSGKNEIFIMNYTILTHGNNFYMVVPDRFAEDLNHFKKLEDRINELHNDANSEKILDSMFDLISPIFDLKSNKILILFIGNYETKYPVYYNNLKRTYYSNVTKLCWDLSKYHMSMNSEKGHYIASCEFELHNGIILPKIFLESNISF